MRGRIWSPTTAVPRILLLLLGSVPLLSPATLAEAQQPPVARAVSVQGTVEAQRAGTSQWQPVKLNDTFSPGDQVRVQPRSRADLALLDQSVLRLNENTSITVQAVKEARTGVVDLLRGAAHFLSRGPRSLEVRTPYTVAGVRGTEFFIGLEPDRALLTIFEGTVVAESPAGSLTLTGGQSAVAETGKAPVLRVVARPRDAVSWALYYPPVLYIRPEDAPAGPARQSVEAYRAGDLQRAFDAIGTVPDTARDSRLFAYRAALLLAVGRVDEAGRDIQQALTLAPNDANALALQAVIAVVQNEKDQALQVAQRAVQAAPSSATPQIALSYAQQARFDLEGARASLEKAVRLEPQNALAWARLAELHASFGDLGKSLDAAQKAVALEPNLSRTQTVLGYAYLTRVQIRQAKEAFSKAIALDSADPLPRLGLGLAEIRESNLSGGSRDLEAAASLDPNNAIVRSYLGKAYYEEKRTGLDEREYSVARELDPRDPTPWFYDAITKQTTNRPVEALRDLERAIELNDNRAVYRSQLLLDADEAARSASLGRIYTDLGFQQLALVEGWKSVNLDPSNHSAHRFLADSYSVLPRHEIARVSELLQSQLLQPLNITPIQPRLAESNLFLISAGGPGSLSFNEFNPLFNRDRVAFQVSGLVGEHSTYGAETVLSGIYRNVSFSVGYTHFETDGFRVNNDQEDDIFNAFVQVQVTSQTSIQAEYRRRETERGDLQLHFFPDEVRPTLRQKDDTDTYRLGVRHAFSPGSILLGSVIYQQADRRAGERDIDPILESIDIKTDEESIGGELQHLFRSGFFNLVTGAGHFDVSGEDVVTSSLALPPPPFGPGPTTETQTIGRGLRHTNVYAYSYLNLLRDVTFTAGASGDFLRSDIEDEDTDQFNPKLGVTWSPIPGTTLRAAAFRVLKRTLITDQTLEPTQVAGFNQFFDDANGTESWRYGVAADQKFGRNVFAGVEGSRRDLTVPFFDVSDPTAAVRRTVDWQEYLARAYVFWTPHEWVALRAEYAFERLDRDRDFTFGVREVDTHRVPLGIGFFHPTGLSAFLTATYYNQEGNFGEGFGGGEFRAGSDDFWVVDVAVNFRLPKRYGFVTVGVTNLFDTDFRLFDSSLDNPSVQPARAVFGRVTLAWP